MAETHRFDVSDFNGGAAWCEVVVSGTVKIEEGEITAIWVQIENAPIWSGRDR